MWLYGYTVCNKHSVLMSTILQKAEHMYELSCCCWCGSQQNAGRGTFCEDVAHSAGGDLETLCAIDAAKSRWQMGSNENQGAGTADAAMLDAAACS
ncbi:hypothetical protein CUZ56_01550 [Saezia sanguinis]|uniref:Uncharacterized protein n=1 Tax=Saezia sanguinis TaxID=1965230 RepID=A0A433SDD7_9BURK|nr:hypothetical protein CUZ56_01550 [Saezia sanguinis]